jgi:hypothetical protein
MKLIQTVKRRMGNEADGKRAGPGQKRDEGANRAKVPGKGARPVAPNDSSNPFAALPTLRETAVAERSELFRKKLAACSTVFDFNSYAL